MQSDKSGDHRTEAHPRVMMARCRCHTSSTPAQRAMLLELAGAGGGGTWMHNTSALCLMPTPKVHEVELQGQ